MKSDNEWATSIIPAHTRLTESVITIIENLIKNQAIEYLSVTGRTKSIEGVLEKIKRKSYKEPRYQMTDISGIRVIVFFESDIKKVSNLIQKTFNIDEQNSLNQDKRLSVNQIGYRSVHFVCDLGQTRSNLPEFEGLRNLKFEIQIRTVLQHAWAELAHDRSYKFTGKLPADIERNIYLYAGMLEIADKGFSDLSKKIAEHQQNVHSKTVSGDLNYALDTISLHEFVRDWADKNEVLLLDYHNHLNSLLDDVLSELEQYGVETAVQLNEIIPKNYASVRNELFQYANIFGYVRDWMILNDWTRFIETVSFNWCLIEEDIEFYKKFIPHEDWDDFHHSFEWA